MTFAQPRSINSRYEIAPIFLGFANSVSSFLDEEAKKGSKRRGAPRSAGRAAANVGPVGITTQCFVRIITL